MKLMTILNKIKPWILIHLVICAAATFNLIAVAQEEGEEEEESFPVGEHGGRLLMSEDLQVEILLYDRGIAPEFHAWAMYQDSTIAPEGWQLAAELSRLGDPEETISFAPNGEFLVSTTPIEEPHSFEVELVARYGGRSFEWEFESFEGRVEIDAEMAEIVGIGARRATAGIIHQTVLLYGRITPDPQQIRNISARFPGIIESIGPRIGDTVRRGDLLASIEANDSLRTYEIRSPINGLVIERQANPGEYAGDGALLTLANYENVWASLSVFQNDVLRIKPGQIATLRMGENSIASEIEYLNPGKGLSMQIAAIVPLSNPDLMWVPGLLVEADITIAEIEVPLVIDNRALQEVGGERVVFIQVGDIYEARELKLGRTDGRLTEVLGGLDEGDHYVVENSYLLKADLEKSLAADDD